MNELPISPRISALQQELEAGNRDVIEAFWREVTALGTPLVEDANGNTQALVTFLWRAQGETTNVVVFGGFTYYWDFLHSQMTRLLDTGIWYKTERVRADVRAWYRLSPNDSLEPSHDWAARTASFLPDSLNGRRFIVAGDAENPFTPRDEVWSVIELPATPPQKWVIRQHGVPTGQVDKHYIHSEILGNDRPIWVYTPPTYATGGEPYALLVLFDGFIYAHVIPTPTILDNLHAAGHIPPVVAVMVNNPGLDARLRELACHPPFVDFLTDELLPWVREKYNVTKDPARTIVGGSSLGGLCAAYAAMRRPDAFGNVLSQSGSFWWKPEADTEPEWLVRQFEAASATPRLYLDVGLLESSVQRGATARMRDVARAKRCSVHYAEFSGGHTFLCWQGTLSDGLLALLGSDKAIT